MSQPWRRSLVRRDWGTVFIRCERLTVPRVLDAVIGEQIPRDELDLPVGQDLLRADYLIIMGQLTRRLEARAARVGAMPVCLPAATDWLADQLHHRAAAGRATVLLIV